VRRTCEAILGIYGIKPWFQKQLQPLVKALWNVHPDVLTWSALGVSMLAAVLLYSAYEKPWLAAVAVPFLLLRLMLNALDGMLAKQTGKARAAGEVINELSDRLSDVAIFLSFAFWPDIKLHLVLLAMIAMMIVSYVGILGKAVGAEREYGGMLGKADRMILLAVACIVFAIAPDRRLFNFNIFEIMFILFIPLASITLLQRLDRIFAALDGNKTPRE
jgi:CDP-diacylglycerol---glycerol-3-phosphate 3-phosphatidyltransferase